MSARREHKGKSDENADSITVPAVHGGPYMQDDADLSIGWVFFSLGRIRCCGFRLLGPDVIQT